MKCSKVATLVALTFVLSAGTALAQNGLQQPVSIQPTAFEYDNYYALDDQEASPSDKPVAEEASCACDSGCDHSCGGCGRCRRCRPELCCCEGDPWRLFPCTLPGCFNITGWIDVGVTANDDDPPSNYNGTLSFNDRDELQLNQLYLIAERAIDNGGCGWGLGGRVDLLYGTDSRFTEARGLETNSDLTNKWNGYPHYGLAMPQAYMEVAYNDLSVKLGHFYTIIGYESVMAPNNFFYSHAYTMQYGEPFTHTGALATWAYSDTTTLMLGFDRGWDNWEDDAQDNLSGLAGITWEGCNGLSVALSGTWGKEPSGIAVNDDRYLYSLVISKELTDRFTYVFQHDYGFQNSGVSAAQDAEWYGINQYFLYKINCCWSGGLRFEWFRDDDGTRVAAVGGRNGGNPASIGAFQGNFYEATLGLNWSPNANLMVRPELRFDWFDSGGLNANLPFGDGTSDDQVTAAVDLIYHY